MKVQIDLKEPLEKVVKVHLSEMLPGLIKSQVKEMIQDKKEFYSIKEACKELNMSQNTLQKFRRNQQIDYEIMGGRPYFRLEEILRFRRSGIWKKALEKGNND